MGGVTNRQPPTQLCFFPSDEELVAHFLYHKAAVLHRELSHP
ncbi:hypothetical protein MUK42_01883 [Musa troglodytarum]|uniref:NAC domain-containing protein n=1 Tax=Musa troglodytarum TaxID=320322 RepID=A0A9E7FBU7_9LILI|nr:hypothetical protein MUK42_01883 [Musa troglodytarum]